MQISKIGTLRKFALSAAANTYDRPTVARLVRDGIEGTNEAWRRPLLHIGKPTLTVITGGRPA